MSDDVIGTLIVATLGLAIGSRVVKAAGSGLKTVGSGLATAVNRAAESSLREDAFQAGLQGKNRPMRTSDSSLNDELDRSYETGHRERELQVNAVSRMVSLNASEARHYIHHHSDE